jgi:hypothetical protein
METVLGFLLLRFAVLTAVVVVLGLAVFAAVVALRRAGHGDRARAGAAALARALERRARTRGDQRHGLGSDLVREAARRLGDGRGDR